LAEKDDKEARCGGGRDWRRPGRGRSGGDGLSDRFATECVSI